MTEQNDISNALRRVLGDSYILYVKTHGYHWNVTGPHFHALHTMFEEQYTALWGSLDILAERLRALGVNAPGSSRELTALSKIDEGDNDVPSAATMLQTLISDHEKWLEGAKEALDIASNADDAGTEDVLTPLIADREKALWMLRSSVSE
ncbi:MAG: DNA starvation/stationary phase protection protein [Pseudomonadota bacterium]